MNNFSDKIEFILQALLKKLAAWEKAGYLSPPLWGGLLVVGIVIVIFFTQRNIIFYTAPITPENPTEFPTVTPHQTDYEPLVGTKGSSTIEPSVIVEMIPLQTTVVPTLPPPSPTPTPLFVFHSVQEEETLIAIASEYGVTTEALLVANDIRDPTNLQAGQQLLIPPRDGLRMPVVLHTIEPGDKLLSIATKYGSSVKDILAANPGLEPDSLPVGQTMAVPVIFSQVKPTLQSGESSEEVYYTVQSGDIPLTIAEEFDVPVEILLTANEITDPTRLRVGQQLLIPAHEGLTLGFPVVLHELGNNDTLLSIATKYGSSVKDILAVNPKLIPASLQPGQTVAVPIIFRLPKPTPQPDEAPSTPIETPPPLVELQRQMVEAVNEIRQAHGLPPHRVDEELTSIAVAHAQDMVVREFLSHVTPEGKTVRDRFEQQGVTDASRVGENIQRNGWPENKTVQAAIDWFMDSRPHRNNILHPHHNRIGVGVVAGPPGWYTFVLNFAQR